MDLIDIYSTFPPGQVNSCVVEFALVETGMKCFRRTPLVVSTDDEEIKTSFRTLDQMDGYVSRTIFELLVIH